MRVLVVGAGNVGSEVARMLRTAGHEVTGTTTRRERLAEVEQAAGEAIILDGADPGAVARAAAGSDVVIVTVSPPVSGAMTPEQRAVTYRSVLVGTCSHVAEVADWVVFLSSISVYGQAGDGIVTESSPITDTHEPAVVNFRGAEVAVLAASGGCVLRAPDIYGHPNDIDFATRVRFAHEYMGGSVPFAADARFNRLHHVDAARAVVHAVDARLVGTYNVVPDHDWGTNREVFDRLAAEQALAPLTFRDEIWTPRGPISSGRFEATGYSFERVEAAVV